MNFKAVIFDYSDVLVEVDRELTASFFRDRTPLRPSELHRRWERWCLEQTGELASGQEMWNQFWDVLGRELSLSTPVLQEIKSFDCFGFFRRCPDAVHALSEARRLGLRIGVLSNSALPMLASPSAPLVLTHLTDVIRVPHRGGPVKPSREAYLDTVRLLCTTPERCMYFDNEQSFVDAAREIGMRAYRVDRSLRTEPPPGVVKNLSRLAELLKEGA
jgi:FMN phosphatase YigB (HAD superfamily)